MGFHGMSLKSSEILEPQLDFSKALPNVVNSGVVPKLTQTVFLTKIATLSRLKFIALYALPNGDAVRLYFMDR
jgi:hypothetical protein